MENFKVIIENVNYHVYKYMSAEGEQQWWIDTTSENQSGEQIQMSFHLPIKWAPIRLFQLIEELSKLKIH